VSSILSLIQFLTLFLAKLQLRKSVISAFETGSAKQDSA